MLPLSVTERDDVLKIARAFRAMCVEKMRARALLTKTENHSNAKFAFLGLKLRILSITCNSLVKPVLS